jgi:hypothetical protein
MTGEEQNCMNVPQFSRYVAKKMTMPSKTLLQGKPYTPSWLMKQPTRYTIPVLRGHYGLVGHYRNRVPEGDADESK